jgi:hypothetical protein
MHPSFYFSSSLASASNGKKTLSLAVDLKPVEVMFSNTARGGMAERLKAPVLKTGDPKGSVGSNPTPSAVYT